MLIFPSKIKVSYAVDFTGDAARRCSAELFSHSTHSVAGSVWKVSGPMLGKPRRVCVTCRKLFHAHVSTCSVCHCTCMHSYIKSTYKLILLTDECVAVRRAVCFVVFSPHDCQQSVCSSRNVLGFQSSFQITDTQVSVPSKYLPRKEAASNCTNLYCSFSSSRCCFASCWDSGNDAGGSDPERWKGTSEQEGLLGKGVLNWCPEDFVLEVDRKGLVSQWHFQTDTFMLLKHQTCWF